ncbi:endonuclease/exonuclease/phosphatase family protein [Aestuariibius insulae]|uniref:endonuclease/exonuclease/phosphatase family protein n=1 Tax=Aestuariibius insulae TaxID=2058287 RepID=UPI00345E4E2B
MRIATYNVEWFWTLFDSAGQPWDDDERAGRYGVTRREQLEAVGRVFQALDADAVMVIEAPDSSRKRSGVRALETFADRFGLRARKALLGFQSETKQEIILLYDPDIGTARHDPQGELTGTHGRDGAPRFDQVLRYDLDVDAAPERMRFSKPPLEVAFEVAGGPVLRLIGVHAKSKGGRSGETGDAAMARAIANRRKQLAQCIWIRRRADQHLEAGEPLIILGDFNDGPGLDDYESLFGRSGVEIVLGEGGAAQMTDPHARQALSRRLGATKTTARFWIDTEKRYLQALLDYVMISPDLVVCDPVWRIWHPFEDPDCWGDNALREALLAASDHFPVTLDLDLGGWDSG